MVQLIKKGGLRERANRSRSYHGSENTETTLKPNIYQHNLKKQEGTSQPLDGAENTDNSAHSKHFK